MKRKIRELANKRFVRNILIMTTGTVASQVVYMALSPVITRLYGPEAFGLMGTFMAIVAIIGPVAALTYPIAIVLPKNVKDAIGLVKLSLYISLGISTSVALILLFFQKPLIWLFQVKEISSYLWLIPIVILFSGILQVVESWLIRNKQFKITAKSIFLQAVIIQGSMVGIGFFYSTASILIFLSALGIGLKAFIMILISDRREFKLLNELEGKDSSLKKLAKKYKDFPILRSPQVFIDSMSQNLPVLLLASFFGPASAGFYTIGRTVLNIPTHLIGKSVGDVFYPRISEAANNKENLTSLIKRATIALGLIGAIPYGIVMLFGPGLFAFVFGEEWVVAGEYARWLALWLLFTFMNQPSIKTLPVIGAQAFHLKHTIFSLFLRITALLVGYYIFTNDVIAIALFSLSGVVLNISLIAITLQLSKRYDNRVKME